MTLSIIPANSDKQIVALRLLFSRFPIEEQSSRLTDALASVERGSLNLDGLLLAEEDGQPVGAALMMLQSDDVALVWPPVLSCQVVDEAAAEHALMNQICEEIECSNARLAQVLIAPDDFAEIQLLEAHGFHSATEMFFLARTLNNDENTFNDQLSVGDRRANTHRHDHGHGEIDHELYSEGNACRYESVIERTYQGSLDCPFLDGFRSGKEALASHRLSGTFDPSYWRLYHNGQEDIGVLLMNEHPDRDAIEVAYFGIVPEYRGKGLGRRVLADGLQAATLTGSAVLFLAVDCGNTYANALYKELGFAELARRKVMLRRFDQLARE